MTRDDLAVGTVLVERYGFDSIALDKVERVTAKQAITQKGARYWLEDGRKVGGFGTAHVATEKDYAEVRVRKLAREVAEHLPTSSQLRTMTEEQLTALRDLLVSA